MSAHLFPSRARFLVAPVVFLLLGSLGGVDGLAAQRSSARADLTAAAIPEVDVLNSATIEQSDLLLTVAGEHVHTGQWLMAALAYEGSGRLTHSIDLGSAEAFASAARAYHAGGYFREAAQMSVAAGHAAEQENLSALAAESFRNAALVNARLGRRHLASAYAVRACDLTQSRSLSVDERRELSSRFGCSR